MYKPLDLLLALALTLATGVAAHAQIDLAQPNVIYGVSNDASSVVRTIEPQTGATTDVGANGHPIRLLATDSQGRIYGATTNPDMDLFRVDGTTGAATLVGTMNVFLTTGKLTFDENDVLYGSDSGSLYTVDTGTAQATLVGNFGFSGTTFMANIASDPSTGVLYGISLDFIASINVLLTIDKATAAVTVVDTLSVGGGSGIPMAFDDAGVLYGQVSGSFYEIDKVTAGVTLIASGLPQHVGLANSFSPAPAIQSITDVGSDQGRQVRVEWARSPADAVGDPEITEYGLWRRVDANLSEPSRETASAAPPARESLAAAWDFIGTVPARGDSAYSMVAPTLCDSTDAGICYSVFFVSAMTADPLTFFDSLPDSGYSVDNLAPAVPTNLQFILTDLFWDEAPEPDFEYHTVYGSAVATLDATATLIGHTINATFDVSSTPFAYYHVTTSDFAGNESGASTVGDPATDVPNVAAVPTRFALAAPKPNPFRGATSIAFDIPRGEHVRVVVYDTAGRRVRTVVDQVRAAGRHRVSWNGTDDAGQRAAAGLYFVRLEAGNWRESRRMVFLR